MVRRACRKTWRAWLRANHGKLSEAWVVFYKKHVGKAWLTYDEAVEEALCFGWIDGIKKRLDDETYVHRFTPRKRGSTWSSSNRRRVEKMEEAGRMTPAGAALVDAAKAGGSWQAKSAAETEHAMPAELEAALETSTTAKATFESLSPSQRRQYVAWVASAKRPDTRERRASKARALLKMGQKLGMV